MENHYRRSPRPMSATIMALFIISWLMFWIVAGSYCTVRTIKPIQQELAQ